MPDFREAVVPPVNKPRDKDEEKGDEGGDAETREQQQELMANGKRQIETCDGKRKAKKNRDDRAEKRNDFLGQVSQ